MKIKNYTSEVPAEQSIFKIENVLIEMGARNIMKEYDGFGKIESISFSVKHGEGIIPFKLPAKIGAIEKLLIKDYKFTPTEVQRKNCRKQAERTAWKNILEFCTLHATMIKLEQVEFIEVFMPYVYNFESKTTFFERIKQNGFKQLS